MNETCESYVSDLLFSDSIADRSLVINHNIDSKTMPLNCLAGGEGASSCSIEGGGISCEVSCNSGYYACCGVGCYCMPEDEK